MLSWPLLWRRRGVVRSPLQGWQLLSPHVLLWRWVRPLPPLLLDWPSLPARGPRLGWHHTRCRRSNDVGWQRLVQQHGWGRAMPRSSEQGERSRHPACVCARELRHKLPLKSHALLQLLLLTALLLLKESALVELMLGGHCGGPVCHGTTCSGTSSRRLQVPMSRLHHSTFHTMACAPQQDGDGHSCATGGPLH